MITKTIVSRSAEETHQLAAKLAPALRPDDVIMLTGDLGAGKTQFTQGIAQGLGIAEIPTSPTFNILLCYEGGAADDGTPLTLYHFDLYRLDDPLQLEDIGFFETLESGGVSVIEWGDKFPEDMPQDRLEICMTAALDGTRTWEAKATGSRAEALLGAWA